MRHNKWMSLLVLGVVLAVEALGWLLHLPVLQDIARYAALLFGVWYLMYAVHRHTRFPMLIVNLWCCFGLCWLGFDLWLAILAVVLERLLLFRYQLRMAREVQQSLNALYEKLQLDGDVMAYVRALDRWREEPETCRIASIRVRGMGRRVYVRDFLLICQLYAMKDMAEIKKYRQIEKEAEQVYTREQIERLKQLLCHAEALRRKIMEQDKTAHVTWDQMLTLAAQGTELPFTPSDDVPVVLCEWCGGYGLYPAAEGVESCRACKGIGYCHADGRALTYTERFKVLGKQYMLPLGLMLLGILGALGLLELTIFSPSVQQALLGHSDTPLKLLYAYRNWYVFEMGMVLLGAVLCVLPFTGLRLCKSRVYRKQLMWIFCLLAGLYGLLVAGMLADHKLGQRYLQCSEDIVQVETGQLKTTVVWLSPKIRAVSLPPYDKSMPKVLTRYGGITADPRDEWERFYVPDSLNFALDTDRLFDEKKTIQWNLENAVQYEVTYTNNFHIVTQAACAG